MKKIIAIVTAFAFMAPALASAATAPNIAFPNGDVTTSGTAGQTVQATFRVNVPVNQVVEKVCFDVISDNLAESLPMDVGGDLGLQEGTHDVVGTFTFPPNTGTYTAQIRGAGIFGGIRSVDCNDNTILPVTQFNGALRTVAGGSTSSTGGSNSQVDALTALVNSLKAQIEALLKPATPTVSSKCAALASKMVGAQYGVTNSQNGVLQGFLLGEGMSIPALQNNKAPFGYWGPQTQSAIQAFKSVNSCV